MCTKRASSCLAWADTCPLNLACIGIQTLHMPKQPRTLSPVYMPTSLTHLYSTLHLISFFTPALLTPEHRPARGSCISDVSFFSSVHSGSSYGSSADSHPTQQPLPRPTQHPATAAAKPGQPAQQDKGTAKAGGTGQQRSHSVTPEPSSGSSIPVSFLSSYEPSEHYSEQESIDITGSMPDNTHSSLDR
jgi:hypothetical protein